MTPFHAKLWAHELTRRAPADSIDRLATALVDAQVDLNPHQVDAALFAFQSPLSKGVLLADEVGLGKTIEAGLVIAQKWPERRRRVLVVTPSNLRKQWHQELSEKFFLPCLSWNPSLTIKKIPKTVLSRCEWGRDDYSLEVASLATAARAGSTGLFGE